MNKFSEYQPTFSVILPTYNRAHLLGRAIRSVLVQTYQDFELIIVDDASPDKTEAVVESFQDNRIVYIPREENGGASATRNTGIRRARGKYISFLDDDDEYLPQFLAETYALFEAAPESVGFTWSGVQWVDDCLTEEVVLKEVLWNPKYENRECAYLSFLEFRRVGSGHGLTVRSSCFNSVGVFDETLRAAVDAEFLIRLVRQFDFRVISSVLVKLHYHSGPRVRKNIREAAKAYDLIIQKNSDILLKHPRLSAKLHYRAGQLYYHTQNNIHGRQHILQALYKNPFYLKAWLGLLLFEIFGSWAPQLHKQISTQKASLYSLVYSKKL